MHASTAPRIITRNRLPWSAVPRQRVRIGILVRREPVRRGREPVRRERVQALRHRFAVRNNYSYSPASKCRHAYATGGRKISADAFSLFRTHSCVGRAAIVTALRTDEIPSEGTAYNTENAWYNTSRERGTYSPMCDVSRRED